MHAHTYIDTYPDVCVYIYVGVYIHMNVFVNKLIYINVHAALLTMRSIYVRKTTRANTSTLVDTYRL